jgi:predicted CXXCH cytochrome family protein
LSCANCHVSHGSKNPFSLKVNVENGRDGDTLCTQCHTAPRREAREQPAGALAASFTGPALEQHTFHKADSAGSRCINCHMSDVNWRLLVRRRDHTYKPPVPEMTAAYGVPNACTTCHDERSPEWAAAQMDAWWGDGGRRKDAVAIADTMYRAGSGDPTSAPALVRLAVDRARPAFIRASAAEYLARFILDARGGPGLSETAAPQSQTSFAGSRPLSSSRQRAALEVTPAIVNALIGAASDPDATVRAVAVRGLAGADDEKRVVMPIIARLSDVARVVRTRAAEALLVSGVATLPGAAGAVLARAQDDYLTSLRMFPDEARNHASIAWMEAQRGRLADARTAADEALRVEPRAARPWVIKGVISAREGKYAEAIEEWKKARSLEPSYPNIDKLIAEAEKLKSRN